MSARSFPSWESTTCSRRRSPGRYFDGLFVSGFGFAASHYGLPDIGFIAWSDIVDFVGRLRTVMPEHHIVVDVDDGYCDVEVACHVARKLETIGASAIVLEDQQRPRRCGHVEGKQIMDVGAFLDKLRRVLDARDRLFVVARTDALDHQERMERAELFAEAGADGVLVDGLEDLRLLRELADRIDVPVMFNQIAGGKSPPCSLTELREAGVALVNYSTPCLFAAQTAIAETMSDLATQDGYLPPPQVGEVGVPECTALLTENLQRLQQGWPLPTPLRSESS